MTDEHCNLLKLLYDRGFYRNLDIKYNSGKGMDLADFLPLLKGKVVSMKKNWTMINW